MFYIQSISSPLGNRCGIVRSRLLRFINNTKFSDIKNLYLLICRYKNNCCIKGSRLLVGTNQNLYGNTAGSFPIVSKISCSIPSVKCSYSLTNVPFSLIEQ